MMMSLRKQYWMHAGLWLVCIYASIPVMRPLSDVLNTFSFYQVGLNGLIMIGIFVFFGWVLGTKRLSRKSVLSLLVVSALYGVGFYLIKIPEEKVHFVQYGLLAVLVHRAVRLDCHGVLALSVSFLLASFLGWADEGIQYLTPGRYYDIRDVVLNSASSALGLCVGCILTKNKVFEKKPDSS